MRKLLTIALFFCYAIQINAQDDLLKDLEANLDEDKKVSSVFKGIKIINMESTKLAADKDFYFLISHRFGTINTGIKDLFGLDNANIRFSFVYGLTDWLNVGVSRSSASKIYDGHIKYRLVQQEEGKSPFTVVGFNSIEYNTGLDEVNFPLIENKNRLAYTAQLLVSRKFDENFSLQLAPVYLHENFVPVDAQDNSQFLLGLGGRYKISKRVTLNAEYHAHLNRAAQSNFVNPLSLGVDIETGGHVFQLHVTNSRFMNESGYLARTIGDWGNGDIYFGFNIWRVF
ncbi:MAG: hypothetical protein CMB99_12245 [Flavobacteriaceae bacterium]|nr:hypothetical protein [Flavobacteriaceae bacterium]|tara:strand:+ start:105429 stop:106283 length:855 start_codon:yes stop_codon:yes gene_type:complete